jgi:hypothetical protein
MTRPALDSALQAALAQKTPWPLRAFVVFEEQNMAYGAMPPHRFTQTQRHRCFVEEVVGLLKHCERPSEPLKAVGFSQEPGTVLVFGAPAALKRLLAQPAHVSRAILARNND